MGCCVKPAKGFIGHDKPYENHMARDPSVVEGRSRIPTARAWSWVCLVISRGPWFGEAEHGRQKCVGAVKQGPSIQFPTPFPFSCSATGSGSRCRRSSSRRARRSTSRQVCPTSLGARCLRLRQWSVSHLRMAEGESWDLSKASDVKELFEMIAFERPVIVTGSTQTLTAARRSSDKGAWQLIQFGHKSASLVANQLTCRERVQVNSQNSGSAEVVGSTGMHMVMVMRMSMPLTSRSSFLWIDSIDNVVRPGLNQQQFLCTVTTDWETIRFWIVWFSAASSLQ